MSTPAILIVAFSAGFAARQFAPAPDPAEQTIADKNLPVSAQPQPPTDGSRVDALLANAVGDRLPALIDQLAALSAADLQSLAEQSIADADLARGAPLDDTTVFSFLVLARWMELDPQAAEKFARNLGYDTLLSLDLDAGWRREEIAAAREMAEARVVEELVGEPEQREPTGAEKHYLWSRENPAAARAWLAENSWKETPVGEPDSDLDPFANIDLDDDNDDDSDEQADPIGAHNNKITGIMEFLFERDLDAATTAAARLGRPEWVNRAVEARRFHDARETIEWLETIEISAWEWGTANSWRTAIARYYDQDADKAIVWLGSQKIPTIRNTGTAIIAERLMTGPDRDYARAQTVAEMADSEQLRKRLLKEIADKEAEEE